NIGPHRLGSLNEISGDFTEDLERDGCKSETARGPSRSNGYAPKNHGPNKRSKDRSLRQLLQKRFEGAEAAQKNAPNQSGRFHEDAASVLQRFSEHHPDAMRPG
ncbi:hypothetical protein QIW46_26585, partial [Pseudomonas fluorescens]|uniref:hypothetical protein n=1 Tax=Pseudomonas fluorescens TaxID=294 RepID=UPI0035261731